MKGSGIAILTRDTGDGTGASVWRDVSDVGIMMADVYDPHGRAVDVASIAESISRGQNGVVVVLRSGERLSIAGADGVVFAEFRGDDKTLHLKNAVIVDL